MKIGVVFPQTEIGQDPAAMRDDAQAVESLGYPHILAIGSMVGANPVRPGGSGMRVARSYCAARRTQTTTGYTRLTQQDIRPALETLGDEGE